MKVSLNWVKQFTDVDLSVDELVEKIGAQLGEVEEVIDLGEKYQGVIIAKVVTCEKHSNADKLSVCWIDDGNVTPDIERNEQGLIQVVCGAPNVRAGLTVAWLPPGSTVPSTYDKDPFVLGARELRGIMSNGMLASASELAISEDHNGIVEIDVDAKPGSSFSNMYQLNDHIIDIENKMFTHRPDCFGILGVAREIAGIQHKAFVSPEWYAQPLGRIKPGKSKLELRIDNPIKELVPRFTAIAMADVTVAPSPLTLQVMLSRVGLRPINNIVDITNYLMYLTGQPLHAYDADKLKTYGSLSLETRMSRKGDVINLLNGKKLELLDDSSILITSNDVPIGIAGAMGGADTEVDDTTKNIVIECANFDMYSIRRTSMKYGLFTDAVTRFNKGQSKLQNERVIEEAVALVQSIGHGHVASELLDEHSDLVDNVSVKVSSTFINERLGSNLSTSDIIELLKNVEFMVHDHNDELSVVAPFWRTDIEIAEDVVEEVGRLYGYDKLSLALPLRDLTPVTPNSELSAKSLVREQLSKAGANEVITYAFVHGNLMQKVGQDPELAFKLSNALSPDLQYFRLSLTPSLLEKVHPNIKAGFGEFALFEIGKAHSKSEMGEDGLPKEFGRIATVVTLDDKTASRKITGAPYYLAKKYVECLFNDRKLVYKPFSEVDLGGHTMFAQLQAPFEPARSAAIYCDDKLVGVVGEYTTSVQRSLKLPKFVAGYEIFLSALNQNAKKSPYTAVPKFPKVEQDITLRVPSQLSFQELLHCLEDNLFAPSNTVSRLEPLSIFQKSDKDTHKQVSFRLTISSYERTLTSDEVNNMLDTLASKAAELVQAARV